MVTNLPPDAKAKWNEVTQTRNPEGRLRLMGEFISLVPKHKGTERMCRQVKQQMARLRQEIEDKEGGETQECSLLLHREGGGGPVGGGGADERRAEQPAEGGDQLPGGGCVLALRDA